MFIYPHVNPIAYQLGPLAVHWYGLMYIIGFFSAWALGKYRIKNNLLNTPVNADQLSDLIFCCALGVVLGGRIGYVLIYNLPDFLVNPFSIFKIWQGGMSFHGGLIGVVSALYLYGRKIRQPFFTLSDFLAPLVPLGLAAGRIGNFINGELVGRVVHINIPWAMVYPQIDMQPRHPSEIYEFLLEGILLFILLWLYSIKPRPRMAVTGLFLLLYGLFRFTAEFFRQPDSQLGFIFSQWLTMGQLLCLPMILPGIIFIIIAYKKSFTKNLHTVKH